MTQPQSQQPASPASEEDKECVGSTAADNATASDLFSSSESSPKQQATAKKDTDDSKEEGDDNAESSSTTSSSQGGQGSGEGYTADCSSDTSSDLSGSSKKKKKDNMIVSVNNLSLEDSTNDGTEQNLETNENSSCGSRTTEGGKGKLKAPPSSKAAKDSKHHHSKKHHHKKHHKKKKRSSTKSSVAEAVADNPVLDEETEEDCNMTDAEQQPKHGSRRKLAQWNGMQVVHPMDPRIDISKVGYMPLSPGAGRNRSADGGESKQGDAPSLEHYVELMEVVRPFFSTYGFGDDGSSAPTAQRAEEGLPQGDPMASLPSSSLEAQESSNSPGAADRGTSGGESRTSTSVSGERSTTSQSSQSAARRPVDAPLHLLTHQDVAANVPKPPQVPLQLAARQQPLAAAAAAEFYAPDDDPADEDDSDTSSMVVLARIKRKHKQSSSGADTSQGDNSSIRDSIDANSVRLDQRLQHNPAETATAMDAGGDNDEEEQEDRKPAARPQTPRQQEEAPGPSQKEEAPPEDDDAEGQGGSASSSSLSVQRIPAAPQANQPRHSYDVAHVVTESASNTNTTTSGSGSGSGSGVNSGSNQGSSGSGNGSSGSGNDGDEGKGSSEDVGTKEENGGASNSNSEDVNSDDRKPDDEKEIAHPVVARRHGASTVADGGGNDPMKLDAPLLQAPSEQNEAVRERKLQDKKRKRMNMRREYEEKVQQEMESSESSSTKGAILLRPGKPVTLDKVLSFTKVARMVIQAGPPFLVVHTNAAYTRLTGIDAHAAVGKPVSALLAVQPPQGTSDGTGAQADGHQPTEADQLNQLGDYQGDQITNADANNGQRLGQSYAEAEEAGRVRAAQASQNDAGNVNLERLVAVCGFGKYHVLHAQARPHHMVGRNVTFVNKAGTATEALPPTASSSKPADNGMRKLDEGNSDTSLISNADGPNDSLKCRSSISPIVSDSIDSAVVTDNNQEPNHKNKRRKHHHHGGTDQQGSVATLRSDGHHHHRRAFTGKDPSFAPKRYQQYVTHYAIQLELFDDSKELNEKGSMSSSSNSVEANLLGLTKDELRRQRQAAQADGEHGSSREGEPEQQQQEEQEDDEMASETTEGTAPVIAVG